MPIYHLLMMTISRAMSICIWMLKYGRTMVNHRRRGDHRGDRLRWCVDVECCSSCSHSLSLLLVAKLMLVKIMLLVKVRMPCMHFLIIPHRNLN